MPWIYMRENGVDSSFLFVDVVLSLAFLIPKKCLKFFKYYPCGRTKFRGGLL